MYIYVECISESTNIRPKSYYWQAMITSVPMGPILRYSSMKNDSNARIGNGNVMCGVGAWCLR